MKTYTITYHASYNFGSFFQAYALQTAITEMPGHENKIIDYRGQELLNNYALLYPATSVKNIYKNLYSRLHLKALRLREQKYEEAINDKLQLTKRFSSLDELNTLKNDADIYIAGSDQIWNINAPDFTKAYLLPGFKNKVSYGVSLGSNAELSSLNAFEKEIGEFTALSFRENYKKDAPVVCDPTLLLPADKYNSFLGNEKAKLTDFIFFYSMKYSKESVRDALRLSKAFNMPVITVYTNFHSSLVTGRMKIDFAAGPFDILSYIKNARYVVTDSYHGTIFSILFQKTFLYPIDAKKDNRIEHLLNELDISRDEISLDSILAKNTLNRDKIDKNISDLREASLSYLKQVLSDGVKHE